MIPLEVAQAPRPGDREQVRPGARLDAALIEHRLITMRRSVTYLTGLLPVSVESLEDHEATGLVVERTFALMVDLVFAINSHVAAAVTGVVPSDYLASIGAAADAGLVDAELAQSMRKERCTPHVQVQLCLDAEPERVETVVADALGQFRTYVDQVAVWISTEHHLRKETACAH